MKAYMNEAIKNTSHYLQQFAKIESSSLQQQPTWLKEIRKSAIEKFSKQGFPHCQQEDWKYTNISAIEKRHFVATVNDTAINVDEILNCHRIPGSLTLVFINGHFSKSHSHIAPIESDILITSLMDALNRFPEKIQQFFNADSSTEMNSDQSNGFTALNTALMQDGAFIYFPDNAIFEKPIQLLHIAIPDFENAALESKSTLISPLHLIYAGKNTGFTLIENHVSTDQPLSPTPTATTLASENTTYLSNTMTKIILDENSQLEYIKSQQEDLNSYHIGTLSIHQKKNSRCIAHAISLGARLHRQTIYIDLAAEGAACTLNGFYFGQGKQHVDYHTTIDHLKPHTSSKECFKGILDDKSRGVFSGKVIVRKDAQKIDSQQSNHTLLLSDDAEIDTKPQLEIDADDVKCSHGATVGQLDESALFFLRSRGLSEDSARSLLIYAFANTVLKGITIKPIHNYLLQLFLHRLSTDLATRELL